MNCVFTLKSTRPELFLLHFRGRARSFIPNLPRWLNGAIITAMESSPQQGLRGHSAEPCLIYWPLTGVWSKQYQSTTMNHVCWKPLLLTMPCNFRVIYSRWLFGARAMPPITQAEEHDGRWQLFNLWMHRRRRMKCSALRHTVRWEEMYP